MASVIEICNMGLSKIGVSAINSLTEDIKAARQCSIMYETLRDEVLRAHDWNFATARASCARSAAAPAFGYDYAYQIPADCLRARYLNDEPDIDSDWVVEGRQILTDEETANLVYTRRVEDTNQFDTMFIHALAARLAAELAVPMVDDNTLATNMWALYESFISRAAVVDANEGNEDRDEANPYVEVR